MSHLRLILVAMLMPVAAHVVPAQQKPSQGRPTQKMTLSFRNLSWFGLAVDCGTCLTSTAKPGTQPAVITQISPGGPAARASLQVGDTILTLDGKEVLASDLPR